MLYKKKEETTAKNYIPGVYFVAFFQRRLCRAVTAVR